MADIRHYRFPRAPLPRPFPLHPVTARTRHLWNPLSNFSIGSFDLMELDRRAAGISSRYLDNLLLKKPRFDLFCIRKISSVNISWEMLKLLKIYPLSIFLDYYILIFQTYYFLHKCATLTVRWEINSLCILSIIFYKLFRCKSCRGYYICYYRFFHYCFIIIEETDMRLFSMF